MNLKKLNLNLLLALDVLLAEKHVSRAATKLNVTQSAMSNILKQLRELFNDPLLFRSKNAMLLTTKAKNLQAPLRKIIADTEKLVSAQTTFDPKTDNREFILGLSDYASHIVLPTLVTQLEHIAPNMKIKVRNLTQFQDLHDFEQGFLHLAIGYFPNPPPNLKKQHLFTDRLVCVMNKKHALAKKELTLERFAACRHITMTFRDNYGGSNVEENLMEQEIPYQIYVRVPSASVAFQAVSQSNLVLVASQCLVKQFSFIPVITKKVPFDDAPRSVAQYWHGQYHDDPAHQWLRQCIKNLTQDM